MDRALPNSPRRTARLPDRPASAEAGASPADELPLPAIPRPPVAERLKSRGVTGPFYKLFNRLERRNFTTWFDRQLQASDVSVVRRGDRLFMMRTVPEANRNVAVDRNVQLVVGLCDRNSIPYFAIPEVSAASTRIAILDEDWQRFIDAVEKYSANNPLYIALDAKEATGRRRRWSTLFANPECHDAAREQSAIGLFEIQSVNPSRQEYFGRREACLVERWVRDAEDGWAAPSANDRTGYLGPTKRDPTRISRNGSSIRTFEGLTTPHVFNTDFPVDLVYLWVDGKDPAWLEKKRETLERVTGRVLPEAAAESRFRDHGELRYSLRSVHRYVPWARKIYIVTDRQIPDWLNVDEPRIRVIDHKELFGDEGTLPTFNSHAIASRLHHIDGLSDNYLYMNDDVMFGRRVSRSHFFHGNGMAKFFLSRATLPHTDNGHGTPPEEARRNVVKLLEREFGRTATRTFFHTPIPQRRIIMSELEDKYPDVFRHNWHSQFRSSHDYEVNSWLHNYYGYLRGLALPDSMRYDYFDLADPSIRDRMRELTHKRDKDCFCINDNTDALPENQDFLVEWLESYFPKRSPFERKYLA